MRILTIAACPLPWPRGTPIRIHYVANAMVDRGHDVEVVTYSLGDETYLSSYKTHRVRNIGNRMKSDPGPWWEKFILFDPQIISKTRRLLAENHFDVIHAHHYEGLICALLASLPRRPIPIVYDAHTLLYSELPEYQLGLQGAALEWIGNQFDMKLPKRADHVFAISERMKEWFQTEAMIPESKVSLIPNGVEHEHFNEFALPTKHGNLPPRIAFAGNLAEYQGVDLLLQSFKRVLQINPGVILSVLTSSDTLSMIKQCKKLGIEHSVVFSNPDYAALPRELSRADVLVNPRVKCDGLPQKLLNYMACSRPIVSFAGSAQVLEHNQTALLVEDNDIQGFADAILALISDPKLRLSMGNAARNLIMSNYRWPNITDQMLSVFTGLTKKRQ